MTVDCVFCKIARKEAMASIVYEDEQVMAFLSHRPVNEGHTLVIPKKHYQNIYEIPEAEAGYLFKIAKRLAHAIRNAENAEGIRIVQNNGEAAGQVIFHLHAHIIPMTTFRGGLYNRSHERSIMELEEDAQKIRKHLSTSQH
ncbi:MAG: HIT family protein [Candidatus Bathyarchaeota archaeon]|nr:HIT family protein [Candidatus Bathyarchaeota archaeon]